LAIWLACDTIRAFGLVHGGVADAEASCGFARRGWLWKGWLARAKVHIFGGDPGAGETTIALYLAAIITRGGRWPDGTIAEPGDVLFWSGDNDIADTLRPRLARAGADLARVNFIAGISEDGRKRAFDPAKHIAALSEGIGSMQRPMMVVVVSLVSAIAGELGNNTETRCGLQPLVDLAIERRVAVLGVHHLSQGAQGRKPLERITGSRAAFRPGKIEHWPGW
jgi:RecA-family ATPase